LIPVLSTAPLKIALARGLIGCFCVDVPELSGELELSGVCAWLYEGLVVIVGLVFMFNISFCYFFI
jgi:hypothetical protein